MIPLSVLLFLRLMAASWPRSPAASTALSPPSPPCFLGSLAASSPVSQTDRPAFPFGLRFG